ncbi:hypothetical protein SH580_00840 [Coraliomargarita algicola]|uniref:PEP-CTERM sorting domain-containing protein n=1 Tax=Coraliomargarita algicola TaxID=3092156 RepID=A0ABZ0RMV1_9BACT|nr:hypothetical protein [Coraliomargarita sp. J2-16]WPJ96247.1 hypothetical protein SH580_00840 [Coraliomargarita sp. J2-16]
MNQSFFMTLTLGSSLLLSSAQAAVITWDTATNVSIVSEVSNIGTTVEAINGSSTSVTNAFSLNGVTFVSNVDLLSNDTTNDTISGKV